MINNFLYKINLYEITPQLISIQPYIRFNYYCNLRLEISKTIEI